MNIPEIFDRAAQPEFRDALVDVLVKICGIDTTPNPDVTALARAEHAVFDILEERLTACGAKGVTFERHPITPTISDHSYFSKLYYTKTDERPEGLSTADCYRDRANLIIRLDGDHAHDRGMNFAVNAHVDVVAPYIPPRVERDVVYGRGTCDDKGGAVAMVGAFMLMAEYLEARTTRLNKHLTYMFVIEEEMGGNGSLSAALDRDLRLRYDALTVIETCANRLFAGNRGCVWFNIEAMVPGVNLFEAAAYVIEQLEMEGRSIRSESRQEMFTDRPVHTCYGIIGDRGEHPSRINGHVAFDIVSDGPNAGDAEVLITDIITFALDEYCGVYGDKTKVNDPTSGKPKVDHHYDLEQTASGFTVTVHGATGHMGSVFENDGAITKMMTMVRSLARSRVALEATTGGEVQLHQTGWADSSRLILEGGQGFVPTHEMRDVQDRLRRAVWRGAGAYFRLIGRDEDVSSLFEVSYEKLHNAAFAGSRDSVDMLNAIECAKVAGLWEDEPIRGWDVSCDARIFAKEHPDLNVITTGPGSLNYAHGDFEQISIEEIVQSALFLAHYILKMTGTVG